MRFMIIVKATEAYESGAEAPPELYAEMNKFNQELLEAGVMLDGAGLKPTTSGARVTFDGPDRKIQNGPFGVTNELIAGYWIWKLDSLDEAIQWVKRCPNPMLTISDIEIREMEEM